MNDHSTRLLRNLYKSVQCAVCLYAYDKPSVLACGHVFCKSCLDLVVITGRRKSTCPLCKKRFKHFPVAVKSLESVVDSVEDLIERGIQGRAPVTVERCPTAATVAAVAERASPSESPDDLKECSIFSMFSHPKVIRQWTYLNQKALNTFEVAMFFDDRETYKCAMRQSGAVLREDSLSLSVGAIGKTTFYLYAIPSISHSLLTDIDYCKTVEKDDLAVSAPEENVQMLAIYVCQSTVKSSPKDHSERDNWVVLSVCNNNNNYDSAVEGAAEGTARGADAVPGFQSGIVPLTDTMISWHRTYCKYLREEEKCDASLTIELADVDSGVYSSRMSALLRRHRSRVSKSCVLMPRSSQGNEAIADKFCMRYIVTYMKQNPRLEALKPVGLFL